jgi:hypothetical protein
MMKAAAQGNRHFLPIVILILFSILTFLYFQNTQLPLTHRGGMGWDGGHYFNLAQQFIDGASITEFRPLVYRIGTPALVAMAVKLGVANDIMEGFFLVNASIAFANVLVVYFLISRFVGPWVALVGGVLFPLHWINAAHHIFFTPLVSDPGGLFFMYVGLGLLLTLDERPKTLTAGLAIVTFLGLLFREFVIVLPIIFFLTRYPPATILADVRSRSWGRMVAAGLSLSPPFIGAALAMFLIRILVEPTTSFSFWKSAMYHFWINSPQYYLFELFSTFGIAIIFIALQHRFLFQFLKSRPVLLYFVAIILVFGFIGGDTYVRYLNWAFPVLFVLAAKSIAEEGIPWWAIVTVFAFYLVFVCRLPWPIPDYRADAVSPFPVFTYLTAEFRFLDLFVLHAQKNVTGIIFYEYILTCSGLILLLRWRQIRDWLRQWLAPTSDPAMDDARSQSSPAEHN